MQPVLCILRVRSPIVLNRSHELVVVVEEPDVNTPGRDTHAAGRTVQLRGRTLQTNNGLCKELVCVPTQFRTGSCWFVAESVNLGNLKAIDF